MKTAEKPVPTLAIQAAASSSLLRRSAELACVLTRGAGTVVTHSRHLAAQCECADIVATSGPSSDLDLRRHYM